MQRLQCWRSCWWCSVSLTGELVRLAPPVQFSETKGYWEDPVLTVRGASKPQWKKADSSGFELYETALKVRPSGFAVLRSTIESIGVGHPQAGHRESDPTTHHLIQQSEICAFDQ